ncbi:MAG: ATP synthase F1 subunit epsilon [Patescibacteria group bacterium]|nr:ATP synthase F1 subunit epsilon [Patescibacteria group bacterium]
MNSFLNLKIITPRKIVLEEEVLSVSAPSLMGEITILPRHINLFSLLVEGILKIKKKNNEEEYLAIGGGYLETNGKEVNVLISRAYRQDEIDEKKIKEAIEEAKRILSQAKTSEEKNQAATMLRRSIVEMKLLKKRKPKTSLENF